jgi:hypothetical protein
MPNLATQKPKINPTENNKIKRKIGRLKKSIVGKYLSI